MPDAIMSYAVLNYKMYFIRLIFKNILSPYSKTPIRFIS